LIYNSKAKEAGVYIVEACGYGSIPAEMGLLYTKKQFDGIWRFYFHDFFKKSALLGGRGGHGGYVEENE
jgi:hypothetical protein